MIDASTSIRQRFQFEQTAAVQFLQQVVRPQTDLAFTMGFDVTPYVTQNYTNDQDKLEAGITKLGPVADGAFRRNLYCLPRSADQGTALSAGFRAQGAHRDLDRVDNRSPAYPDDAIKSASARRPSSTPSAPTSVPAATGVTTFSRR